MSDYRIIKTRWYHRLWDWFFKADEPNGFEIGTLACKLYLGGKTGTVYRIGAGPITEEVADRFIDCVFDTTLLKGIERRYRGPNEEKSKHDMRSSPSKQETMPKGKGNISTVMPQTLEHDSRRITGRGMGRLP